MSTHHLCGQKVSSTSGNSCRSYAKPLRQQAEHSCWLVHALWSIASLDSTRLRPRSPAICTRGGLLTHRYPLSQTHVDLLARIRLAVYDVVEPLSSTRGKPAWRYAWLGAQERSCVFNGLGDHCWSYLFCRASRRGRPVTIPFSEVKHDTAEARYTRTDD
jgi:hypothetical protein